MRAKTRRAKTLTDHFDRAAKMRRNPGVWVWVRDVFTGSDAVAVCTAIRSGANNYPAYRSGIFEAKVRRTKDGTPQVWARWMGVSG